MQTFTKSIRAWVATCALICMSTLAFSQVVINEFSPDPTVGEAVGAEWAELYNGSAGPANIGGWILTTGSCPSTPGMTTCGYSVVIPTGTVMPANSFLLISNATLMSCATCDYAGLHTALGVLPNAPTGVADFAAGKADAAFLNLATCGCAVSAAGCTTSPSANTSFVLNNATAATDGERIGLFNNLGVLVDAAYYEQGNQQNPATSTLVTNSMTLATVPSVSGANAYPVPQTTLPAIPDAAYFNLGTLIDGCTSSYNRVPDGGTWGLNSAPSRKGSGGNQTTATDQPTPGYKNDYTDNGSANQQPFNFYVDNIVIGDAEDVRTGATLIYGVPSDFIGGATANTFTTKPASAATNRKIITCTTGGETLALKYENYNFQHVEENSVLASSTSGTGSATTLAGSYITIGIDGATPTAAPANSTGTATGTTGWSEQGGSSGLSPGNSSILPDATGKTTLTKTVTMPAIATCEIKTALYNMITRNYGNSLVCSAGRSGNSSSLGNAVGISNTTSSDCWEGASYLVTLVGKPTVPTAIANTAFVCPGRKTDLSATNCTYNAPPANADVAVATSVEFYASNAVDATGAPTGTLLTNPVTVPTGGGLTVYAFSKATITPVAGVPMVGMAACYSAPVAYNIPDPGAACALGVTWAAVEAKIKNNDQVAINWITASETNTATFEVERSNEDGKNFEKIATTNAKGNSNTYANYTYLDTKPLKGLNYYRLKQTDLDGKFEYSKTVSVTIKNEGIAFQRIYPNPFANVLNVNILSDYNEQAEFIVYDAQGKIVLQKTVPIQIGLNKTEIETANLAKGVYNLRVLTPKNTINSNIIK